LAGRDWLNGSAYGLADISWIANVYRLMIAKLPVDDYSNVVAWANCIIERPAFDRAVTSYKA
jgi:glutathione S-transferase